MQDGGGGDGTASSGPLDDSPRNRNGTADRRGPITPLWTPASCTYVRLHEGSATPRPCYGRRALASWVDRLAALPGGDRGYVDFNNDHRACAVDNARAFEALLHGR